MSNYGLFDQYYSAAPVNITFGFYLFQTMKMQARTYSTEIKQIDLDINRTFRNHIMFQERFGVK